MTDSDPDLEIFLREVIRELRSHMLEVEEPRGKDGAPWAVAVTEVIVDEDAQGDTTLQSAPSLRAIGVQAGVRLRPEPSSPAAPFEDSKRYTLGDEVGRGGMGRVLLATDPELGRRVALKVLLAESAKTPDKVQRFVEEAQVAAQLEHPNIVPVYDFGVLSAGTPYFTMRFVKGRTLKDIVRGLRAPDGGAPELAEFVPRHGSRSHTARGRGTDSQGAPLAGAGIENEFTRVRLLGIYRTVCMAVAYAHARGVVHRDIKPHNVMIGAHGEVYVMDWGLAKVFGRKDLAEGELAISTSTLEAGRTIEGTVKGTPQYMSPEQALGEIELVDERADVYALGAMLYEILTLVPPFIGQYAAEVLTQVREESPMTPRARAPQRDIPEELEAICLKAMAREPWRRFASAREIADEIDTFLEGSRERDRRRHPARRRVGAARDTAQRYAALTKNAVELSVEAQAAALALKGWEPIAQKEPIWELEDREAAAEEAAADAFGEAVHLYTEALAYDPADPDAREGLASLYYAKFIEAVDRREPREARAYRALVEQYHDGRFEALLRGDGSLRVVTEPAGARCVLHRYHESGRRRITIEAGMLPAAPVSIDPLAMGGYVIEAAAEGYLPARFPFLVERCGAVELKVALHRPDEIPSGYCLVPAGPFLSGGDREAFGSPPRRTVVLGELAIARFPVTCEEYLDFLNAVQARDPDEAFARSPRSEPRAGHYWATAADGRWFLPTKDREGRAWDGRWPITNVSFEDAVAFCRWASEMAGRPYRLPTDLEWEKAARGPDGRIYPWGDSFDATFCKMWSSRPGRRSIEPIGTFASDESPYGVRDMAGGVQEWCDGWTDREANIRVRMGGSWMNSAKICRSACRYGWPPEMVKADMGFRLAMTLP